MTAAGQRIEATHFITPSREQYATLNLSCPVIPELKVCGGDGMR